MAAAYLTHSVMTDYLYWPVGEHSHYSVVENLLLAVAMSSMHFLGLNLNWKLAAGNSSCFAVMRKSLIKKAENYAANLTYYSAALLAQTLASSLIAFEDSFDFHGTEFEELEIVVAGCGIGEVALVEVMA